MLNSKFWGKYFKVYDVLNLLIPYQELLNTICDELDINKEETILEAGCGTGNLAIKIKEKGARVIGLDNCREALKIYQKKCPDAEVVYADLTKKLPFPNDYFDKITSNNALYTVPEEKQLAALKELYRILKPGGKIVLTNPKRGWKPFKIYIDGIRKNFKQEKKISTFYKLIKMIIPTIKIFYYNYFIQKENKFHFFNLNEQRDLLQEAGFIQLIKTKFVYSNQHFLNSASKKYIGSKDYEKNAN